MAKLVVLTQSLAGRSCDLTAERTTIGRVEENAFQIAEPSVSSRHCEILLRGGDIVVKDLGSTNGTFINGEKISEAVLKPGQTLKLGNVELKLDVPGAPATAPAPATTPAAPSTSAPPSAPPAPAPQPKKEPIKAPVGGISTSQLETGGRGPNFDTSTTFTKKKKGKAMLFWVITGVVFLIIGILIIIALVEAKK